MYIHAYSIMNTNSRVQSVVLSDVYCTYMPPYPVVTTVASSVYVRMTYVCVCIYVRTYLCTYVCTVHRCAEDDAGTHRDPEEHTGSSDSQGV